MFVVVFCVRKAVSNKPFGYYVWSPAVSPLLVAVRGFTVLLREPGIDLPPPGEVCTFATNLMRADRVKFDEVRLVRAPCPRIIHAPDLVWWRCVQSSDS